MGGDVLWHSATMPMHACRARQIRVSMLCWKCAQGVNITHEKEDRPSISVPVGSNRSLSIVREQLRFRFFAQNDAPLTGLEAA